MTQATLLLVGCVLNHASPRILLALVLGAFAVARPLAAQDSQGPKLVVNAAEIRIAGRVQTQFNTTTAEGEPTSELFLRRVRLGAEVRINDRVSGEVETDLASNRVLLTDAFVKLTFSPGMQLLAGKAYRPFSLLAQTSSARILPIERGATIRGIDAPDHFELIRGLAYSERDVGIQLLGTPASGPLGLQYAAGVFRGPLQGTVGRRDSYQYAGRLSVAPLPRTRLGAGWSSRHFARDTSAEFELKRGNAWEIDVEYGSFAPGIHLLGEVAFGDFNPFTDTRFFGTQVWLGYRTQPRGILSAVEPIIRASYGAVDGRHDGRGGALFTPGLNLYFGGWNRFMVNYDWWLSNGGGGTEGSFKAQLQLAF